MSEQRKKYTAEVQKAGSGRQYDYTISTSNADRVNDRVLGWNLEPYRKNPIVLFMHDHTQPVGRAGSLRWDGQRLTSRVEFAPPGISPRADSVAGMVEHGILRAASVGFQPGPSTEKNDIGGYDFHDAELLEWSIVSVGAHRDALRRAKAAGVDVEPVRGLLETSGADPARLDAIEREMFGPGDPLVTALGEMAAEDRFLEREAERIARRAVDDQMFLRKLLNMPTEEIEGMMREAIGPVVNREIDRRRGRLPD